MQLRIVAAIFLALACASPAGAAPRVPAPSGLKAFLLRPDETPRTSFDRTPSFAWTPVRGARRYQFELSTSRRFDESGVVWSSSALGRPLRTPAVAVTIALPWMNGDPHALYAHVRAVTREGVGPWSAPLGFDMEAPAAPEPLPSYPGLVRWKPVPGATGYHVWYPGAGKIFSTVTNVADQRELYSFHRGSQWTGSLRWRVRAVREIYGSTANGLPAVSYGPWSDTFTATNPAVSTGPLRLGTTVTVAAGAAHELTPGFVFHGDRDLAGGTHQLFRTYVFTDRRCVNVVYRGAIVGSPAYAPRTTGPLALPSSQEKLDLAATTYLSDGKEGTTWSADYLKVVANEQTAPGGTSAAAPAGGVAATTGGETGAGTSIDTSQTVEGALVDLWDSGRYFWTVVGVDLARGPNDAIEYRDAELAQDVCAAGRIGSFGKVSRPTVTASAQPFASGLSPLGRLVAAAGSRPSFYGAPLVSWEPAPGATQYELQVSKTPYPWQVGAKPVLTHATSTLVDGLAPGVWYYRVRGIDPYLPGKAKQMTWSAPVALRVAAPRFVVIR